MVIQDAVLCRTVCIAPGKPQNYQVVIPDILIQDALLFLHGDSCAGHYSTERTLKRAQSLCFSQE